MVRTVNARDLEVDRFTRSVFAGASLFAAPSTAERLNAAFASSGLDYRVSASEYVMEGTIVAVFPDVLPESPST